MPKKYQPDAVFLRHVPLRRVHLFTAIQLVAIAAMFVIKYVDYVNMIFPLLIVALCFLRRGFNRLLLLYCRPSQQSKLISLYNFYLFFIWVIGKLNHIIDTSIKMEHLFIDGHSLVLYVLNMCSTFLTTFIHYCYFMYFRYNLVKINSPNNLL